VNGRLNILIIDDDEALLESCKKVLSSNSEYSVETISDSTKAVAEIESNNYDLFISDLSMPGLNGFQLLEVAKKEVPETPFVIFSAFGSTEKVVEAMRLGAFDFIEKPFKADRLRIVVEKSLKFSTLQKQNKALTSELHKKYEFDNIIGKSQVMQNIFGMISRVAGGDSSVTITGASGTGKELVARSIHAHSRRHKKAFVPVNCGALPENLFESELFGYEKGAFTGANQRKYGLLEYANHGTFFLDEVCELSPALQVKLLRVLQERNIRRVGGNELIDIDVRIIAATNHNMEEAMQKGIIREDLYYRLNVISIQLPSLKERLEDIPILVDHFIREFSKMTPKEIKGISDEAMRCLESYPWPGNVRELENTIERAVALAQDDWIQLKDLPDNMTCKENEVKPRVQLDIPLKEAKENIVADFEREYLTKMLKRHNGNISKAAKDSQIDRRTFHRLINRYKINTNGLKVENIT